MSYVLLPSRLKNTDDPYVNLPDWPDFPSETTLFIQSLKSYMILSKFIIACAMTGSFHTDVSPDFNSNDHVYTAPATISPLIFSSLETKLYRQQLILTWSTNEVFYNERIQIERSMDEKNFSTIGTVIGQSNGAKQYSFTDGTPFKGISFYRLRHTGKDGHVTLSAISKVDNRIQGLQIKQVFPNPARTELNLRVIADESSDVDARIFNMAGAQVLAVNRKLFKGEQNWRIVLPELKAGVFELILYTTQGGILSERIMIN